MKMDLRKRLAYRAHLARHLSELTVLLNYDVTAEVLLSLEETEDVRARSRLLAREPSWRCEIPFSEKTGARFVTLLHALHDFNSSPVYVWTPLANPCGLPRPLPLIEVNFAFRFDLNREGIFSILTSDLADEMLLDFSKDERDEEVLEIEVSGPHWGRARY